MKYPLDRHRSRAIHPHHDRRSHVPRRHNGWHPAGILLAAVAAGLGWAMLPELTVVASVPDIGTHTATRATFGFCHTGGGTNCVVDGDTFRMGGVKIRIADIDTPETHPARCPSEAERGEAATHRLHDLLNAGAVSLTPIDRDTDRYGRRLRVVSVDGRGVGDTLIAEGLARPYAGGRRPGWCD